MFKSYGHEIDAPKILPAYTVEPTKIMEEALVECTFLEWALWEACYCCQGFFTVAIWEHWCGSYKKQGQVFEAGRQCAGHCTIVLVPSGRFCIWVSCLMASDGKQHSELEERGNGVTFSRHKSKCICWRTWTLGQRSPGCSFCDEVLAFHVSFSSCAPGPRFSAWGTREQVLVNRCLCMHLFYFSDGGQHAHCRRDRTYLFLSAPISPAVHEKGGGMMNDDVLVCCTVSLAFFFFTLLFLALCISPSLLESIISWCRILCVQCFRTMGHRIPCRLIIRRFCSELVAIRRKWVPTTLWLRLSWRGFSCRLDLCEWFVRQQWC